MKTGIKLLIFLSITYLALFKTPSLLLAEKVGGIGVIRLGVLYKGDREKMEQRYKKIESFFKNKQMSIELQYFKDRQEIAELVEYMKDGKIDIAGEFAPIDYLESKKYLTPLVRTYWNGKDSYYGIILVKAKEKTVLKLEDLKGKIIALTNPRSASGYIYPRAKFFQKGIDMKEKGRPSTDYVSYIAYGSAKYVLEELLNEDSEISAGAISYFFYSNALIDDTSIEKKTKLLNEGGWLGPIKNGVFACRKGFPPEQAKRFKEALISLTVTAPPDYFEGWNGFKGWLPWEDGDYAGLISAMRTPSPPEKEIFRYLIIASIVVLFLSGIFVFRLTHKKRG